jgi:CDP-6-deoxy-D-xylo-4-hexulose-3-dehydrase
VGLPVRNVINESAFAKMFNVKHTHMVNSGSSANLVLVAGVKKHFGWEDGDEVIVSVWVSNNNISTCTKQSGSVFVDVEYDTLNFDIHKIEEDNTKN